MSFEGYYQILCENGHLSCPDVYDLEAHEGPWDDGPGWTCHVCGAKDTWRNLVDQTNTSGEEFEVKLEVKKEAVFCKCEKCGNEHMVEPVVYEIPTKRGK